MAQYQEVKYGELTVLGHNGDQARMRSRFTLRQRPRANGVKPSAIHMDGNQDISVGDQHSVSYCVSTVSTIAVEYAPDRNTDMFQIGRSAKSPIDYKVTDTTVSDVPSAIPRFGCRIVCQRSPPHSARIYAAGFDTSNNIFLGENAVKWRTYNGQMDALTNSGVLVAHPVPLHGVPQSYQPGLWREISVCGNMFALRETSQQRGNRVVGESQELVDGSLIELGGVTLLWRSAEGLAACSTAAEHLEVQRQEIYAGRPCFVYNMIKLQPPSSPPPPPPPHSSALGQLPVLEEEVPVVPPLPGIRPASFPEQIREDSPPPPGVFPEAMLEKNIEGGPSAAPMHDALTPPTPPVSWGGGPPSAPPPPTPSNVGVAAPVPAPPPPPPSDVGVAAPVPAPRVGLGSLLDEIHRGIELKNHPTTGPTVSGGGVSPSPPPPPPPSNVGVAAPVPAPKVGLGSLLDEIHKGIELKPRTTGPPVSGGGGPPSTSTITIGSGSLLDEMKLKKLKKV